MRTSSSVTTFPNLALPGDVIGEFVDTSPSKTNGSFSASPAQKLVRRFLETSPYRGLVLFHKLGAGKTCAAIGAAEATSRTEFPRVVVMLPAALEPNFLKEVGKCGSDPSRYEFLHYNGLTLKKLRAMREDHFDDSVIIIDEVHNITKSAVNADSQVYTNLFRLIAGARRCKVIAMTGTPMVNVPAESAFLLTLVKGFTTRYWLTFPWLAKLDLTRIDAYLRTEHPCVTRHGFDVDRHRIWIELLPDNFRYVDPSDKARITRRLPQDCDNETVIAQFGATRVESTRVAPFSLNPGDFDRTYVDWDLEKCKDTTAADFMRRARGFVSFYQPPAGNEFPTVTSTQVVRCTMSDPQFDNYVIARLRELELDKKLARRDKTSSVYRTYSRRTSNFCFPSKTVKLDEDVGDPEAPVESNGNARLVKGLRKMTEKELGVGGRLPEFSTKYATMMQHVLSGRGQFGTALIYSAFRNVAEGIPAVEAVLQNNGFERLDIVSGKNGVKVSRVTPGKLRYVVYDSSHMPRETQAVFNGEMDSLDTGVFDALKAAFGDQDMDNARGQVVSVMIISESGSEGISLKNVRQVHIMEPYWQRVRIQQVVGRAVRAYSHHNLPKDFRNVDVYLYASVMSDSQKRKLPPTLVRSDRGVSTDEHLIEISRKKGRVIDSFVDLLQRSAVDCSVLQKRDDCFFTFQSTF